MVLCPSPLKDLELVQIYVTLSKSEFRMYTSNGYFFVCFTFISFDVEANGISFQSPVNTPI
jgi:hypothetical protein